MKMIEVVTKKAFVKDVIHESYVPLFANVDKPFSRSRKVNLSSHSSPSPNPSPPLHRASSKAATTSRPLFHSRETHGVINILKKGLNALYGCHKKAQMDTYDHIESVSRRVRQVEENQFRLSQNQNLQPPLPPLAPYVPYPPPEYLTNNLFDWANDYFDTSGPPEASYSDVSGSGHDYGYGNDVDQLGGSASGCGGGGGDTFDDDETLASAQARMKKGKEKASTSRAHHSNDDMDED
ncbi:unnamed protein product [Urochloa humidicola]